MGGEIKTVYMTMGEYDLVFVCEASAMPSRRDLCCNSVCWETSAPAH